MAESNRSNPHTEGFREKLSFFSLNYLEANTPYIIGIAQGESNCTMASEDSTLGTGAGGMMKKLLFPASASGANDTFKTAPMPSSSSVTAIPTVSSPRKASPPTYTTASAATPLKNSNSIKQSAPPRFFSSTHPTLSSSSSFAEKTNTHNNNNSSPEQPPLQTPARVPSSPPRLNRQPVTPSSQMGTKKTKHASSSLQDNTMDRASSYDTSSADRPAARNFYATGAEGSSDSAEPYDSPCIGQASSFSHAYNNNNTATRNSKEEDENLLFLKQFKAKRREKHSPQDDRKHKDDGQNDDPEDGISNNNNNSSNNDDDDDETKTEIHDNTFAAQQLRLKQQQQQQEQRLATTAEESNSQPQHVFRNNGEKKKSGLIQQQQQHSDESGPETPLYDKNNSHAKGSEAEPSPHGGHHLESFPSYYDNPYHNPLVASAMKPNDLFRNNNITTNRSGMSHDSSQDSDVNSNASQYGTVIGAPSSLLADRFAEVDAMERAGQLAMQQDDDDSFASSHDDHNINNVIHDDYMFDAEEDPALVNYKAFRVHDDAGDGDDVDDDGLANEDNNNETSNNHLPEALHTPHKSSTTPPQTQVLTSSPQQLKDVSPEDLRKRDELGATSAPIRDAIDSEAAFSTVDSEIDQLVRRSASESSGGAGGGGSGGGAGSPFVQSCSSNNSAEVFRVPSTGSASNKAKSRAKPPQRRSQVPTPPSSAAGRSVNTSKLSQSHKIDREDEEEELQAINGARSSDSSTLSTGERARKRPNSSLQRALSNPRQIQEGNGPSPRKDKGRGLQKEDEKEEKEDDLHLQQPQQKYHFEVPRDEQNDDVNRVVTGVDSSHNASQSPGKDLASTLQRIGDKLAKLSPPRAKKKPASENQFFFDIEDDEEGASASNSESIYNFHSVSAPTTPRLQRKDRDEQQHQHHNNSSHYSLAKIQEAFPQSPSRGSAASLQAGHSNAPSSFLLRSPGSTARLMADFRRESSSSSGSGGTRGSGGHESRGSSFWNARIPSILQSESSASLGNGITPRAKGGRQRRDFDDSHPARGYPLRIARGCMSFDTTMDSHYDYDEKREKALFRATTSSRTDEEQWLRPAKSYDVPHYSLASPSRPVASAFRRRFKDIGGRITGKTNQTQALYGSNRSWDFSGGKASSLWSAAVAPGGSPKVSQYDAAKAAVNLDPGAFRVAPYVRQQQQQHHPHAHGFNNSNGSRLISGERRERLKLMNDTAVAPGQGIGGLHRHHQESLEFLQTPQRIEIEREDALNLLACLVERGVALHSRDCVSKSEDESIDESQRSKPTSSTVDNGEANSLPGGSDTKAAVSKQGISCELESETIDSVVTELRRLVNKNSSGKDTNVDDDSAKALHDHSARMEVLDELVRSHTYALEMKRASMSANAWLRSIGRKDEASSEDIEQGKGAAVETKAPTMSKASNDTSAADVEVLALKAMLHQAQMKAREKESAAIQLNEELARCRAEIGRLKSVSRSKTNFTSPNRSILDDDEDDDESVTSTGEKTNTLKNKADEPTRKKIVQKTESDLNIIDESVVDLDSSFFGNEETAEILRDSDKPLVRELAMFKSALSDANSIIKKLHGELQDVTPGSTGGSEAPVIEISEKAFSVALVDETGPVDKSSSSDEHPDSRMINVRMLDAENFVTDFETVQSLPPPPDHGLRSPIVSLLLQQWTQDEALHNSLMAWMDRAISGEDPSQIPPLTISSLDHQVRDGFTMHVLPLLLRRPDILVEVKTRAHRTTTYDIAVSVKSNSRASASATRSIRQMESTPPDTASAINSVSGSAVTAHVQNGFAGEKDVYEPGGSTYSSFLPHRSSDDRSENTQQQVGIMGALGGAIGGLLSRRKPNASTYYEGGITAVNNSYDMGSAVGAAGPGPMDFPPYTPEQGSGTDHSDPHYDPDEPYHRLVSAPPGRIGVSFVEYRGHAMVSDVSEESPLLGW